MNELDQIIDEHSRYLVRIAYLYVKNWSTAEDVVQEVFVTYFQKSDQFRNEASLKTYLTKMTANRAKDYLRSWKHKKMCCLIRFSPRRKAQRKLCWSKNGWPRWKKPFPASVKIS